MRRISRRTVLKLIGSGASAFLLPGLSGCKPESPSGGPGAGTALDLSGIGPIDRTLPDGPLTRYSGDGPALPHGILRNQTKDAYLASRGGLPEPSEKVPLVVVGGGISGLTTAYQLRHHQPVILERAPRFGGNARGESWQGIDYAIGAAYFVKPEADSKIDGLV
ncbi:MAG: NAD(P)/FAD-dependent oxidoreductase, partial [Burkholderiales bacterium]|nr:NAD(P)/FAD-dependent oxidoreductase [Burkholderiales bacterium]